MASKNEPCIYCGSTLELTVDHIPPKCLFPKPRPSNLLTVPCCRSCNQAFGREDEYFRAALALRYDVSLHPSIAPIQAATLRAIGRKEAGGFGDLFLKSLRDAEIITPSGISLGPGGRYDVDMIRIRSVVERIVRGLFYKKTGERLPDDIGIVTIEDELLEQNEPAIRNEYLQSLAPMLKGTPEIFGNEEFVFLWQENRFGTNWFLVFYSRVVFHAATRPKKSLQLESVDSSEKPKNE